MELPTPVDALTFQKFIEWAFMALVGGGVAFCAKFLCDLSRNVAKLNESFGVILERMAWHEKELERHGERIERLENKPSEG